MTSRVINIHRESRAFDKLNFRQDLSLFDRETHELFHMQGVARDGKQILTEKSYRVRRQKFINIFEANVITLDNALQKRASRYNAHSMR